MKGLTKKGFTLIELLAVIVVLAVIMLVAVTAVVPMMERAKKQSFITEVQTIVKGAENYYMYANMTNTNSLTKTDDGLVECIDINDSSGKDLLGQYVEEKGKTSYDGVVLYLDGVINFVAVTNGDGYYLAEMPDDLTEKDESAVLDEEEMEIKAAEDGAEISDFISCSAYKSWWESRPE